MAVTDLCKAFNDGLLPNSFENDMYFARGARFFKMTCILRAERAFQNDMYYACGARFYEK